MSDGEATAVVGVDIGGTGSKEALADLVTGALVSKRKRLNAPHPATQDSVASTVKTLSDQIGADGLRESPCQLLSAREVETASNLDESWIGIDAVNLMGSMTNQIEWVLWPHLIIISGGMSRKSDKFLPDVNLSAEIVPATLHNDAGIVGAALFAPRG